MLTRQKYIVETIEMGFLIGKYIEDTSKAPNSISDLIKEGYLIKDDDENIWFTDSETGEKTMEIVFINKLHIHYENSKVIYTAEGLEDTSEKITKIVNRMLTEQLNDTKAKRD
jgi:hypothetical protein